MHIAYLPIVTASNIVQQASRFNNDPYHARIIAAAQYLVNNNKPNYKYVTSYESGSTIWKLVKGIEYTDSNPETIIVPNQLVVQEA